MDLSFLTNFIVPVIVGICLVAGWVIKNLIPNKEINRFIPLIVCTLGVVISIWNSGSISPSILLAGLISGAASTGLYEAFRNLINNK